MGKTPISPEKPAGEDIRYEPEFEALQAEIEKLSSTTSTGAVDWQKVVDLSGEILGQKSKNLIVAGYLCVAMLQTDGLDGLAPGMAIYADLVENFWPDLYPLKKRMRGRKNAIEWLLEKLQTFVESLPEDASLRDEERAGITESLNRLDTFLAENMGDNAPFLHPLKNRVDAIPAPPETQTPSQDPVPQPEPPETKPEVPPETEPVEAAEAKPVPSPAPSTQPVAEPRPAPTGADDSDTDARNLLRRGLADIRQAATLMREKAFGDPAAYRLTRIAAWIAVEKAPPATDGRTLIPPPADQYISTLKNLHQQGSYRDLIDAAEAGVGQYLFWFDLTRYVSESLGEMGHHQAVEAIDAETALYHKRLEGIENLAFADGTPFADEETRDWLKAFTGPREAGLAEPVAAADTGAEAASIARTYQEARTLVKQNKLIEALELMQNDLSQAATGESALHRRMSLARLLLDAGKPVAALPHLMEILADIDRHKLEAWGPATAVNALTLVYHGFKKQKQKEVKTRADDLIERIAMLNPAAAVRLTD